RRDVHIVFNWRAAAATHKPVFNIACIMGVSNEDGPKILTTSAENAAPRKQSSTSWAVPTTKSDGEETSVPRKRSSTFWAVPTTKADGEEVSAPRKLTSVPRKVSSTFWTVPTTTADESPTDIVVSKHSLRNQ
ncbi:unnamed protein product, partial [Meganyctiphanes norvegica]